MSERHSPTAPQVESVLTNGTANRSEAEDMVGESERGRSENAPGAAVVAIDDAESAETRTENAVAVAHHHAAEKKSDMEERKVSGENYSGGFGARVVGLFFFFNFLHCFIYVLYI